MANGGGGMDSNRIDILVGVRKLLGIIGSTVFTSRIAAIVK